MLQYLKYTDEKLCDIANCVPRPIWTVITYLLLQEFEKLVCHTTFRPTEKDKFRLFLKLPELSDHQATAKQHSPPQGYIKSPNHPAEKAH